MPELHVIRVQTVPDPNPTRAGQPATWITYQVDGGPVRTTFVPKANPSESEVIAAARESERAAATVQGKRFTI